VAIVALILGFGLLARCILNMRATNRSLCDDLDRSRRIRRRAARRILTYRRQLDATGAELRDADDRNFEMGLELSNYRQEEAVREEARRLARRAMAN